MNNTSNWNDFNTAESQQQFDLIPNGTIAPVRMTIQPGGYNDLSQHWDGGYATHNSKTGSVYLNCEFVILQGEFAKRKLWQLIGLHSSKGPEWQQMGRSFIRAILNSANGLSDKDNSPQAQQKRRIENLQDLDSLCFVVKIVVKKDEQGNERNQILSALTPDHASYQEHAECFLKPIMNNDASNAAPTIQPPMAQPASQPQTPPVPSSVPHWAK